MLASRPDDARVRFALAVEYLNVGRTDEGIAALRAYLEIADDEGNAWGRLAAALGERGDTDGAADAYREAIRAAHRHGHPTMAEELGEALRDLEG